MEMTRNFFRDEAGASAAEYGLLIVLIAVACIYAVNLLGTNIVALFTSVASVISGTS